MILYERVRHEDIGANLAAPRDFLLLALNVGDFFKVFTFLDLNELRDKHFHSHVAVLVLAAFHLAGNDNARRNVDQTHGRRGLVDLLSARTARTVHFHLNIVRVDFHAEVLVNLRHNLQRGE